MISHVTLGVRDLARAAPFYRAIAAEMNLVERAFEDDGGPEMLCFHVAGLDAPRLYIATPFDERAATAGNGTMIALIAPSRAAVDAAYASGLDAGGTDAGPPGPRPHYEPDYYGAYLRDPDGNKLHLVHRDALQPFRQA
ncbi:VOC family protein [uncultured Jannaschia sp.]|uniref:VOC family protein n=1 Tax=uncultured Jannaschia sp. TaxID=293347 RepID=UPI00262F8493|nr:VOC family protein [uncultured Jannaschia sp.]